MVATFCFNFTTPDGEIPEQACYLYNKKLSKSLVVGKVSPLVLLPLTLFFLSRQF